jgi:hypothetical protein
MEEKPVAACIIGEEEGELRGREAMCMKGTKEQAKEQRGSKEEGGKKREESSRSVDGHGGQLRRRCIRGFLHHSSIAASGGITGECPEPEFPPVLP